jgi:hypothetical protein
LSSQKWRSGSLEQDVERGSKSANHGWQIRQRGVEVVVVDPKTCIEVRVLVGSTTSHRALYLQRPHARICFDGFKQSQKGGRLGSDHPGQAIDPLPRVHAHLVA